ncbi:type 2 isopentenyl-diphosphate Delta-isomerase [Lagierella massiliensis]|uniref:type 2 isopentenyl-diphosphate Delta-isomerase n=1 Tax=Lagierella massiliensis TaxID=1689303 RepID=UPI0006D76447|nr:type 2 isopentenyl-diphosphate Delta-isomerase [Lagierella massiliensis]
MRQERKREHVESYLKTEYVGDNLFKDIYIENNSLPGINFEEIDTKVSFLGKTVDFPLMINAMTGGADELSSINEDLARIARDFNIPMAVGSQKIGIEYPECKESFKIARDILGKDGILIGNLSANASLEELEEASSMIDADAMQLHLNVCQEMFMDEGDRNFKDIEKNIEYLSKNYEKPIIIKEVGFGISATVSKKLTKLGINHIDIAGTGGTNFIEIEDMRNFNKDYSDMYHWGIPTAKALIDCKRENPDNFYISSGGVNNADSIIKSFILGANFTAISGEVLRYLMHGGFDEAEKYVEDIIEKSKIIMMLLGVKKIKDLKNVNYTLTGRLKELIQK